MKLMIKIQSIQIKQIECDVKEVNNMEELEALRAKLLADYKPELFFTFIEKVDKN